MAIESDKDRIADGVVGFLMAGAIGGLGYLLTECYRRSARREKNGLRVLEGKLDRIEQVLQEVERSSVRVHMLSTRRGAPVTSTVVRDLLRGDGKLRRLVSQL